MASEPIDGSWRARLAPLAVLALVTLYCHWFILTNDSPIWDGWYWLEWLKTKNWAPMREYTSAQGLPFHYWLFAAYAYFPNIVVTGMWVNILCLFFESVVIYWLALRLAALPAGEALSVAILAQAIPVFSGAQDFPLIALIAFRLLFFLSMIAATIAIESRGARHWMWRGAALVGFYIACVTNGALIVFYGVAWLLFLFHYRRTQELPLWVAVRRFVTRFPDLLLVPPAVYAARTLFIPQFGWYETYNQPGANLPVIHKLFASFFTNVIPYHFQATGSWFVDHPVATLLLGAGFVAWWLRAPRGWALRRGGFTTAQYLGFGAAALCLGVLPLAVGGKFFDLEPVGEPSRHCMLTSIPLAILLFAVVRCMVYWTGHGPSRTLPAIVGGMVIVFGSQYWPIYLGERIDSLYSQSVLRNLLHNEEVRRSSIILAGGRISAFRQRLYGTMVIGGLFGDKSRLVSQIAPRHPIGYLPADTEFHVLCTTILPSEFSRIDPGGQQTRIIVERAPTKLSAADLAWRELRLRWSGEVEQRDLFLAGLTEIETAVIRRATPFAPGAPPPAGDGAARTAAGARTNSIGMDLVPIPGEMWVAKYETTQGQFEKVMGHNPSLFKDPWRPVECVTWHEAVEFCLRLNAQEAATLPAGYAYRLPTGEEFDRYVGDAWSKPAVIVGERVTWRSAGVGTQPANEFGLHDTVGNVWEWCLDWWDHDPREKISKGGAFSNERHQLEPDEWKYQYPDVPLWERYWISPVANDRLLGRVRRDYPDQGFWNRGFRIVLAGPPPATLKPARPRERQP